MLFSAWRESRRVCCTTTGTSESITQEKPTPRGTDAGSCRSLKRLWQVRWAGTVKR